MSEWVDVPLSALSEDALNGLIVEVITREGTDYGEVELALDAKVAQLKRALRSGEAKVVFDIANDYATIVSQQ